MKLFTNVVTTLFLLVLWVGIASAQTLTNGWTFTNTITAGLSNTWTFSASTGDSLVVRMGRVGNDTIYPYLRLYGPGGTLLASLATSGTSAEVTARATNSGTFTVIAANNDGWQNGGNGIYEITLGRTGSPIVVSPGDEGGPLTNGFTFNGSLKIGQLNVWSITANSGDNLLVRMGRGSTGSVFPSLRLYGPDGTLLASSATSGTSAEAAARATNSGTFIVIAANNDSWSDGANGAYQITMGKTGSPIVVAPGDQGGPLTNAFTTSGTLAMGQLEVWSFTANSGDNLVVRMGRGTTGTVFPSLRLYGPDGTLLVSSATSGTSAEAAARATNSGTFMVIAANNDGWSDGATGTYEITLAKTGSPIVVAPGDQGGPLTNGFTYGGSLNAGQLDVWSFSANSGDNLVVRMGRGSTGSVFPSLRLYGPDGSLLASLATSGTSQEVTARATNSGTFMVIAANNDGWNDGANGTYVITLGKTGSPVIVAPGHQGGSFDGSGMYVGTLAAGELNVWQFTECAEDAILIQMTNTPSSTLFPYLRLYGPDGSLLVSVAVSSKVANLTDVTTNSGTFILIAANNDGWSDGGNGGFQLTVNGLSDGFKTCSPLIIGTNVNVAGVGGPVGTNAILFTTTNIANPALWTPVRTNPFDQFGVFEYTNTFNPVEPKRFFRLSHP